MRSSALTRGTVALTAVATSAALLTAGQADAATAAAPPFEPTANAVGTITFYNSTGAVITHGSTDTGPFAAYAVGSSAPRTGDAQAVIVFANPKPKSKPYTWYARQSGVFSTYPVTTGPTAITGQDATHPVYTGTSADMTLEQFESQATQYTGTGYTDVVQVRLQTADTSSQVTKTYDDADLLVDTASHTWSEVYPTGAGGTVGADKTSVSISAKSKVAYGDKVKVTGTLRDTTKKRGISGQSVKLYEGSKKVTSVKSTSGGALSASVKLTGAQKLRWVFAGNSAYKASSSATRKVAVTTAATIATTDKTVKHGHAVTFYGSTTPATSGIKVDLQERVGKKWKTVATAKQKRQKLPNGKTAVGYRVTRTLSSKGSISFRVLKPATSKLSSSVSKTITEHVQ